MTARSHSITTACRRTSTMGTATGVAAVGRDVLTEVIASYAAKVTGAA